jgi:hypothetical protein
MNDDTQKQPVQNPAQPPVTAPQPAAPASSIGMHKEMEVPVSDFIKPSEEELVLEKELREAGAETVSEKAPLTKDHEDIGIKHSLENTQPNLQASDSVTFPLTNPQIENIVKKGNTGSSGYWLAILIKKLKKAIFRRG